MQDERFTGLRVTAHLLSPVAVQGRMMLDGIMAAAIVHRQLGEQWYQTHHGNPSQYENVTIPCLDIEGEQCSPLHVYAASDAVDLNWQDQAVRRWRKFLCETELHRVDFKGYTAKIVQVGGRFKTWNMPVVVLLQSQISWIAWGDRDGTQALLDSISSIGKHRGQGYGKIAQWDVVVDRSFTRDDVLRARPVPVSIAKWDGRQVSFPPRSPYWMSSAAVPCVVWD